MESRRNPPQPSRPNLAAVARDSGNAPCPSQVLRPLSDIREITEPSLIDMVSYVKRRSQSQAAAHARNGSSGASICRESPINRKRSVRIVEPGSGKGKKRAPSIELPSSSYSSTPEAQNYYAIPLSSVPRRSSSQQHPPSTDRSHARKPSIKSARSDESKGKGKLHTTRGLCSEAYTSIPGHGTSESPVKNVGLRLDAVTSDSSRQPQYKTVVRVPKPIDILEFPIHRHPRLRLDLQVAAPLFAGGSTIEGHVKVVVDDNERVKNRRTLGVASISIDLLGFEEVHGGRRAIFLALGTELVDFSHPPPSSMVEPDNPLTPEDRWWTLKPCLSSLPFILSLPLDTGPPPFQSRHASIRFILCVTAVIRDAGKHYRVRSSKEVCILPTYDPEKALISLPSPLIASDELTLSRWTSSETLTLTAGIHRQIWVSGSSIFVDLHIANKTRRAVKRIDLHLERDVLCYKHGPASTSEKPVSKARIFDSNDKLILAKSKEDQHSDDWTGVSPYTSTTKTCKLELPRGHATVRCGKYFEVRYFLNVTASVSNSKLVSVQLPIILIHMNSLDVLPNSVAQVAAAIEEKRAIREQFRSASRSRTHGRQRSPLIPPRNSDLDRRPSYTQGRAFAAPRQQSLERQRAARAQMRDLRVEVDSSLRKHPAQQQHVQPSKGVFMQKLESTMSFGALSSGDKSSTSSSMFGSIRYHTPPQRRQAWLASDVEPGGLRDRLRRMQSFNSIHSKRSIASLGREPVVHPHETENLHPRSFDHGNGVRKFHIAPHTLGLASSNASTQPDHTVRPSETALIDTRAGTSFSFEDDHSSRLRSTTSLSFREKFDRSRFAILQKASRTVSGKGKLTIERVKHNDVEGEAPEWI